MCLSRISTTYDTPSDLIVDGWKEFGGTGSSPTFATFALGGNRNVPLDQWLKAEAVSEIRAMDGKTYRPGFHVYAENRSGIRNLRRVYLRKITCTGSQDGDKAVIAQEMYVPSNPNAWPPLTPAPTPARETKKRLRDRIKKIVPYKS